MIRHSVGRPEFSEESPETGHHTHTRIRSSHIHTLTHACTRAHNINSCIYIFIYMLYIIYIRLNTVADFSFVLGAGARWPYMKLYIFTWAFTWERSDRRSHRPCTGRGSRVSGFSCRQWSIVAPWLGTSACEKEKRSGFAFNFSFFSEFFSFLFYITTRQWWAASWTASHSRFMCTPIASRSETRQRLPHSWDALLASHFEWRLSFRAHRRD